MSGKIGHYKPDNPNKSTMWYDSGVSAANCDGVYRLLNFANSWNEKTYRYQPFVINSNTFAHLAGEARGFVATQPPRSPAW